MASLVAAPRNMAANTILTHSKTQRTASIPRQCGTADRYKKTAATEHVNSALSVTTAANQPKAMCYAGMYFCTLVCRDLCTCYGVLGAAVYKLSPARTPLADPPSTLKKGSGLHDCLRRHKRASLYQHHSTINKRWSAVVTRAHCFLKKKVLS